jgi:hypothetical protein
MRAKDVRYTYIGRLPAARAPGSCWQHRANIIDAEDPGIVHNRKSAVLV